MFDRCESESTSPAPDRYEEFLQLLSSDRSRLYGYIFSLLPHHADAEDVYQRVSILLWRKFDQFDRDGNFLAWASGVAFYEVRNFLRTAHRDRLQFNEELIKQIADQRLETLDRGDERLAALRGCLEKLPPKDRELIRVVYHGDRTIKQIAESTDRALQTLYNQLGQARRKLLDCVRGKMAVEG